VTSSGPLFHEIFGPENEEMFFLVRELPDILDRLIRRFRRAELPRRSGRKRVPDQMGEDES